MTKDGVLTDRRSTGPHRFQMEGWISCTPFERLLSMKILEAADGQAVLTTPFPMDYAQGGGLMHGGALVSLADTAVVMARKSILPPLSHFATILLESRVLAPVKQGILPYCSAQMIIPFRKMLDTGYSMLVKNTRCT